MDEHVEDERKECDKSVATEDDSILDFKSPVQLARKKANNFINSDAVQIRRRAIKLKSASKNHNGSKPKQQLKERKKENESEPSTESSFFKSNGSSKNKDPAVGVKVPLVCPLCFKTFKDTNSRTSHMKICATKNNIPTKKLLDAIDLQKRQEDERKSLGLLIAPTVQEKKKSVPRPANLYEESNLELALALSKSLQEAEEAEEVDLINENDGLSKMSNQCGLQANVLVSGAQLKKFGNRRKKGPTVLQTRSDVERKHILTERISEILMADESITQKQNEGQEYDIIENKTVLQSRLLQELWNKEEELWNEAKLAGSRNDFYVKNLSEFIIPEVKEKEETIVEFTNTCNMHDLKLSQYRIETSNNEKGQETKNIETSAVLHEKCGSCQNRQFIDTMINNWTKALNNSSASDIIIFVENDKHIWAHKLVFYVQCSNILLDATPNDTSLYTTIKEKICWLDISYEIALAFLEFIYCRIIKKYLYVLDDIASFPCLRNLARKYKVPELFSFLERKEIEVKQETDRVHNECNKELISEEGDPFELSTDNVENLIRVANDSELSECEKLIAAHSMQNKSVTDKSELNKTELTKEIYPDSLLPNERKYLGDMSAIRNSNVSPDLFDESNDTINSDGINKIIYVGEAPDPKNEDEDDENINKLSGSQFSTPKRENHSQIIKPRNNLSLFIEKFQRENGNSDSDTDSEIAILPSRPKLCRNPFRTKQYDTSDQYFTSTTSAIEGNTVKKKRGILSMFDSITNSEPGANVYTENHTSICEDLSIINDIVQSPELNTEECTESYRKNNSMNESVLDTGKKIQDITSNSPSTNLLNDTAKCSQNVKDIEFTETLFGMEFSESIDNISLNSDTDEDEISMYSKYKKGHENNSIVEYRNFVQEHTLKSNANSNIAHDECAGKSNTDTDIILISDVCDPSEFKMSGEKECDVEILSDVNRKSSISSGRNIFENQKVNNSSKLRYSRSESNLHLQEIRNKLESSTSISLIPEKRSIARAEKTNENDDLLESIYLANVHIDNDDNDDENDSLDLNNEVQKLNKEILSPLAPKENRSLIVTNNSSTQLKNSEKSFLKSQGIRKFQRKSISETSLHTNGKEIKNSTSEIYKNRNKTPCKCRCTKNLEVNVSPEMIRDSVTPPPNYDGMLTPHLHAELNKYGLKMQKRKRAVKLLTYIYNELHPTISTTQTSTDHEFAIISSEDDEPPEKKNNVDYISNYECQSPTSQEIITGLQLQENVIDEEKVFDEPEFTSVTDDTPNIRDMFVKFITFNKELHNKILAYEPLCINSLHTMLKADGLKCKMNTLMDFLDEQCITFYLQENRNKR